MNYNIGKRINAVIGSSRIESSRIESSRIGWYQKPVKKVVIAIDSFKASMSSRTACHWADLGVREVFPDAQTVCVPIADGGEGTVEAFLSFLGGDLITVRVTGPDFKPVEASYGILKDRKTAVIEMAAASGLPLMTEKNAAATTTFGTGELILHAVEQGCENIILGLGGSATNDGGVGALAALGVAFLDENGMPVHPTGGSLDLLRKIDYSRLPNPVRNCRITLACDVGNTLCGAEGASFIYGPQKGADPDTVRRLDHNLLHYADCVLETTGMDISTIRGGGAAGGIAAGLMGFLNAEIKSGIQLLLETIKFEEVIRDADLLITGEGRVDAQSAYGKVPAGVGEYAKKGGVPCIVVAGDIGDGYQKIFDCGVSAVFSINHLAVPFADAKKRSDTDMKDTVKNICLLVRAMENKR